MKIYRDIQQRSIQWAKLHMGRPTASGFDALMTPLFKQRTGEQPQTYLFKRLAETLTGDLLPGFNGSWSTEQGTILEEEARPFFELEYDLTVEQVGFIVGDDERAGCSPDGLIGDDEGLEIKCPYAETHVKYLVRNELPPEYAAQVHGSLWITGRKRWHFLSYHRGMKPLHLVIERDEAIMEIIGTILKGFYGVFDEYLKRLQQL